MDQKISERNAFRIPPEVVRAMDIGLTKKQITITNEKWYDTHNFYGCTYLTCRYMYANYHHDYCNTIRIDEHPNDFVTLRLNYLTFERREQLQLFDEYTMDNVF